MITFHINDIFPQFILRSRTGSAMAKAIEAGMNYFLAKTKEGVETVLDPDKMPEWRLDEMAWEMDCAYDYQADVEVKREWIKTAMPFYSIYGTPEIMKKYILAVYDDVTIQEAWEYGGDPYHFNVVVDGTWSEEAANWVQIAATKTKNVRSILDAIIFNAGESSAMYSIGAGNSGIEIQIHSVTI